MPSPSTTGRSGVEATQRACRRPCQCHYHFAAPMVPLKISQRIGSLFERLGPVDHTPELASICITLRRSQDLRGTSANIRAMLRPRIFPNRAGCRIHPIEVKPTPTPRPAGLSKRLKLCHKLLYQAYIIPCASLVDIHTQNILY